MHLSLLELLAESSEGFHFYLKALLQCFQCFKNQLHVIFSSLFPGCLSRIPHPSTKYSLKVFALSFAVMHPHDLHVYYEANEAEL